MSEQIDRLSTPRGTPATVSQATAVEQARAVAEVAAAVRVAQDFPRDELAAYGRMRAAAAQPELASRAFYSLPRGGSTVEGSSVHLARELARCWGNFDYGIRELRRDDAAGESELQAWSWDQETNVRASRSFIVPHARMAGRGRDKQRQALTDLSDIANNNNSVAARAVRETIYNVLPSSFRLEAETIAAKTLQGGDTPDDLAKRVADGIAFYARTFGVTHAQLEDRLGRPSNQWTPQDVGFLQVLSGELSRGEKRVVDEFPATQPAQTTAAAEVAAQTSTTGEYDPTADPTWSPS